MGLGVQSSAQTYSGFQSVAEMERFHNLLDFFNPDPEQSRITTHNRPSEMDPRLGIQLRSYSDCLSLLSQN